jgi:hypothetical protein
MNENDLRDCFAMFALLRMSFGDTDIAYSNGAEKCYRIADAMLEARNTGEELGIAALKPKRKYARKET